MLHRYCAAAVVVVLLIAGMEFAQNVPFVRGDVNADTYIDIADAVCVLSYLFGSLQEPCKGKVAQCGDAADANNDGHTSIDDAITILAHLFAQAGLFPAPFPSCGTDPSGDALMCTSFPACEGELSFTLMLPGDVPLEMVSCPAGTIMMGRYPGEQDSYEWEDWQHEVTLTRGFHLGKYVVTKRQWQAVMGTAPWVGQDYVLDDPDSPAVYVNWEDAQAFIAAVNVLGQGTFGLPTEAQWEHACRAGTTTRFYWGDDPDYTQIGTYAWYRNNTHDIAEPYAHVVGQKLPNAWGLYDMPGNVFEWCHDWWQFPYFTQAVSDPTGPPAGSYRVIRGGCWEANAGRCRSAYRDGCGPWFGYHAVGFRLARN